MCTFYRIIQFVYSRRIIVRIRLRAISETVFQFNVYRYESISLLGIAAIASEFFRKLDYTVQLHLPMWKLSRYKLGSIVELFRLGIVESVLARISVPIDWSFSRELRIQWLKSSPLFFLVLLIYEIFFYSRIFFLPKIIR